MKSLRNDSLSRVRFRERSMTSSNKMIRKYVITKIFVTKFQCVMFDRPFCISEKRHTDVYCSDFDSLSKYFPPSGIAFLLRYHRVTGHSFRIHLTGNIWCFTVACICQNLLDKGFTTMISQSRTRPFFFAPTDANWFFKNCFASVELSSSSTCLLRVATEFVLGNLVVKKLLRTLFVFSYVLFAISYPVGTEHKLNIRFPFLPLTCYRYNDFCSTNRITQYVTDKKTFTYIILVTRAVTSSSFRGLKIWQGLVEMYRVEWIFFIASSQHRSTSDRKSLMHHLIDDNISISNSMYRHRTTSCLMQVRIRCVFLQDDISVRFLLLRVQCLLYSGSLSGSVTVNIDVNKCRAIFFLVSLSSLLKVLFFFIRHVLWLSCTP